MSEIFAEVHTEQFEEYLSDVWNRYKLMIQTMRNVAEIIRLATIPYVPLDTGALEQSYEYQVVENSPFILLGVGFDAEDPESGFHYAEYQHNTILNHPKRGIPYYLTVGIHDAKFEFFELIETDFLSLFSGGVSSGSIGNNNHARVIRYVNL